MAVDKHIFPDYKVPVNVAGNGIAKYDAYTTLPAQAIRPVRRTLKTQFLAAVGFPAGNHILMQYDVPNDYYLDVTSNLMTMYAQGSADNKQELDYNIIFQSITAQEHFQWLTNERQLYKTDTWG